MDEAGRLSEAPPDTHIFVANSRSLLLVSLLTCRLECTCSSRRGSSRRHSPLSSFHAAASLSGSVFHTLNLRACCHVNHSTARHSRTQHTNLLLHQLLPLPPVSLQPAAPSAGAAE